MSKLIGLIDLVQVAIDKGTTSIEEVHKAVINEPLDKLKKIATLETPVKNVQEVLNQTISIGYTVFRTANQKSLEFAKVLAEEVEKLETDAQQVDED